MCRSLGTMLESGIGIQKSLELASRKTGNTRVQEALQRVRDRVRQGEDLTTAMREQEGPFPELFVDMVDVAEKTGTLPEVLRSLAAHYETHLKLKKDFIQQITLPLVQLVAAILIVAFVIFILGIIGNLSGGATIDVLGLGLTGTSGALTWLTCTFGGAAALYLGYHIIVSNLSGRKFLDPLLMGIPVVGSCLQSFAIARFSWAFALTQRAGMSIKPSLEASLGATSNGAFIRQTPRVWQRLVDGAHLCDALQPTGLFPEDYIHTLEVAETSGTVPEALERLSPHFNEDAQRSLKRLVSACAWLIWALVAAFIIYIVFSVFMIYLNAINSSLKGM